MDVVLFLGAEGLKRMTNPAVSPEERESLRYELSAYLESEDGARAGVTIVEAFNRLKREESLTFDRETIVWYLDWVTRQQHQLSKQVEPASVAMLWSTFNETVVRTRAIEALVDIESARDVSPAQSEILGLVRLALGGAEAHVGDERRDEPADVRVAPDVERVLSQIVNTLLTDRRRFSLQVLGRSLEQMPDVYRQRCQTEIDARLTTLGDDRASALRGDMQH